MIYNCIKTATTAAAIGTGNATVGAAAVRARPLSDIPQGKQAVLRIEDEAGTDWELSLCTILGANSFSRDTVLNGKNGPGVKINFTTGNLTVQEVLDADSFNALVGIYDISFAQSVPLTKPGASYMVPQTVSGALTFTPAAAAVRGALVYLRLTPAAGAPAPDFSAFKEWGGSQGYDNRTGIVNQIQFFCDGVDTWFSASQAVGAVAVAAAATAVTLAASAASGYVGTPVTVTVGTNNPLTGSQTESVQLTSNVAGTFSVNPVLLSAGTASAPSVFTPSAAGSATITGTATGTPSLTAGTIGYTANAVTVPGQMAAPAASAGITSASLAFTLPANGGHAITGLTITPYIAGVAQSAINTATLTSPYNATGLTANTAYTFRMHASNDQGPGADSVDSNSVTPTASATAPGAPTIGTAVAGDGYVDVAFTAPASNGGAAIIDYTATLSTGQTATGTASPIRVTAPNGPAVTATVKARNSVNSSAASAASNSVTPAAAVGGLSLTQLAHVTGSGTGPYTADGASYGSVPGPGGIVTAAFASGVDGSITLTMNGYGATSEPILGVNTTSTLVAFGALPYAIYGQYTFAYKSIVSGSIGSPNGSSLVPANGDVIRLRRVGSSLIAEVARAATPTTFTTVHTWTGVSTGVLYIQAMVAGTGSISNLTGSGLA